MQSLLKLPKPISKQSLIKLIVLLFFLLWTVFLGVETWKIQHSCTPMFGSLNSVSSEAYCHKCPSDPNCVQPPHRPKHDEPPDKPPYSPKPPDPPKPLPPDLVGIGAASLAAAGLAITGAPVAVVAGVGIAIWFLFSSAIKAMNGN